MHVPIFRSGLPQVYGVVGGRNPYWKMVAGWQVSRDLRNVACQSDYLKTGWGCLPRVNILVLRLIQHLSPGYNRAGPGLLRVNCI